MYGMRREGPKFAGGGLYELFYHFGDVSFVDDAKREGAERSRFQLLEDWSTPSFDPFRIVEVVSYTGVGTGVSEPDYEVALSASNDEIALSHGWKGATYHENRRWRLGKEERTTNYLLHNLSSGIDTQALGIYETLTSVADIEAAIEQRLMEVFGKLADAETLGRYALTWEDVAAMFVNASAYWRDKIVPRRQHDDEWFGVFTAVETQGRGAPLELRRLKHTRSGLEQLSVLRAESTCQGWVLSETSARKPFYLNDGCPWYGNTAVFGNSPYVGVWDSCPQPERHTRDEHREPRDVIKPWGLNNYLEADWALD